MYSQCTVTNNLFVIMWCCCKKRPGAQTVRLSGGPPWVISPPTFPRMSRLGQGGFHDSYHQVR